MYQIFLLRNSLQMWSVERTSFCLSCCRVSLIVFIPSTTYIMCKTIPICLIYFMHSDVSKPCEFGFVRFDVTTEVSLVTFLLVTIVRAFMRWDWEKLKLKFTGVLMVFIKFKNIIDNNRMLVSSVYYPDKKA